MNNKLLILTILLFSTLSLFSSPKVDQEDSISFSIVDSYGETRNFSQAPQSIISSAPSITEMVFALGREDRLIGRTDFCDYPEEVSEIESIGSLMDPNIEKIIELNPDVLIVSTHFPQDKKALLENLGIQVIGLYNDESFQGVFRLVETLGILLEAENEAESLITSMENEVRFVEETISQTENRPSVYYVVGYGTWGDFTPGGDTFIHQLIEKAGGRNIAADMQGWAYSFEKIVEADPDIIICSAFNNTLEGLRSTHGYKDLRAIETGQIFSFDNNTIDRQGPRTAEGLRSLAEIIHPELFQIRDGNE